MKGYAVKDWTVVVKTVNRASKKKLFNETKIGQMLKNKMGNRWCEKQFSRDLKFDQQKFDIYKFSNTTIHN